METLSRWLQANKLHLNVSKTKFLVTGTLKHQAFQAEYNGKAIGRIGTKEDVKSYKYLGLLIDGKLDWHAHVEKVTSALNSGIYALIRLQGCSTQAIRKNVYNALIKSHLEYMTPIWGACKKGDLLRLLRKQKKAIRLVCGFTNQMGHTSQLFKN